MKSGQRFLVIDDSLTARMRFKELLEADGATVLLAEDASQGAELLRSENPDCILLDYKLPDLSGLEFLTQLQADRDHSPVPVVMLTGEGSESVAVEAMKAGAQDYLVKGEITQQNLHRAIQYAIEKVSAEQELTAKNDRIEQLTQELTEANSQLALMSRLDPLTKLFNRRVFDESITFEHDRSVRCKHKYAVIMLDIDHFKQFNDTQGHQAGDDCLRRVARCISDSVRVMDIVGRYGGEEFIILAPETPSSSGRTLAERIRAEVYEMKVPHSASTTSDVVTVSLGVADGPADKWEDVVRKADEALYAAKRSGRNRVCIHEAQSHGSTDRSKCEVSL